MANNFQNGPGGRLIKEEEKSVNFGFMRPPQRAIAEASTTSVYQPTPEVAESRIYLQNRPGDFKNRVVADIANAIDGNVKNMNPEQYKRVATTVEALNKKYGSPSWEKEQGRAYYHPFANSVHINPKKMQDPSIGVSKETGKPDIYFQELAHAAQDIENNKFINRLKGLKGLALYQDNDIPNKGRYGTPGEYEYEAHEEVAPRLWNEFKNKYELNYGEKVPPQYENDYFWKQTMANVPKYFGGKLKYKGKMLPEISIVQPVKRP